MQALFLTPENEEKERPNKLSAGSLSLFITAS
jgi:hypothetical protein